MKEVSEKVISLDLLPSLYYPRPSKRLLDYVAAIQNINELAEILPKPKYKQNLCKM